MKRTPLRRISERRLRENELYRYRQKRFLELHPYCAVWLAEHGIDEETAIKNGGVVQLEPGGPAVQVPLSTEIHHTAKRRRSDLLDETHWLAVSQTAHRRIEMEKTWARRSKFLCPF